MSDAVNPVPADYPGATPYLVVRKAAEAIEFYVRVFGAEETVRLQGPDGGVGHAELRIAGGMVMLADEVPEMDIKAPPTIGGSPVGLLLYFANADEVYERALEAGAEVFKPMCDQFYGDRSGTIDDPFGHRWTIAQRIEDLSHQDVKTRFSEMFGDES